MLGVSSSNFLPDSTGESKAGWELLARCTKSILFAGSQYLAGVSKCPSSDQYLLGINAVASTVYTYAGSEVCSRQTPHFPREAGGGEGQMGQGHATSPQSPAFQDSAG